ncbi:Leupaxin [Tupaia chinensis]|uniref:Leupaxin n=1 Tax=Tupaia chinensis TaxID=246437 RepID=L9J948_TUPCH|nr:Leupaxin [Tupaia chinensis]
MVADSLHGSFFFFGKADAGKKHSPDKQDQKTSLDSMLGGLEQELQDLGIATVPKGHCTFCRKPIAGKVIHALGQSWHPEHFICTHCKEEIGSSPFFERNGLAYCPKDYHHLFSPRCAYCAAPILDKVLTAMNQTWHPEHFFCSHCGEVFGAEGTVQEAVSQAPVGGYEKTSSALSQSLLHPFQYQLPSFPTFIQHF